MKEIKRVETLEEAILIQSQLESSGIVSFLKDNEIVSVYPLYSNAIGGIITGIGLGQLMRFSSYNRSSVPD